MPEQARVNTIQEVLLDDSDSLKNDNLPKILDLITVLEDGVEHRQTRGSLVDESTLIEGAYIQLTSETIFHRKEGTLLIPKPIYYVNNTVCTVFTFAKIPYVVKINHDMDNFANELFIYQLIARHYPNPEEKYLGRVVLLDIPTKTMVFPKYTSYDPSANKDVSLKILQGLAHLHAIGIIHRDIKPDNILMRGSDPVIIDYGLSTVHFTTLHRPLYRPIVTAGYKSPELFVDYRLPDHRRETYAMSYGFGVDTWAFAMLHLPFHWKEGRKRKRHERAELFYKKYDSYTMYRHVLPGQEEKVEEMKKHVPMFAEFLTYVPEKRPSVFDYLGIPTPSPREMYQNYYVHTYVYPLKSIKMFTFLYENLQAAVKANTLLYETDIPEERVIDVTKSVYSCEGNLKFRTEDVEKVQWKIYDLSYVTYLYTMFPTRYNDYKQACLAFAMTPDILETTKVVNFIIDVVLQEKIYKFDTQWDDAYQKAYEYGMKTIQSQ